MKFIFEVHIKPGHTAEQYADCWVRASKILQRAAGARSTRLHRMIGDPNRLLAVATWESKAARDAMEKEAHRDASLRALLDEAAEHCEIRVLGEFDEAQWIVDPSERK